MHSDYKRMIKLSILVTNYNYGHYLEETLSSLFQNKRMDEVEVLFVDDASTDNSREVVEKLNLPLRTFCHEKNLGQEEALNTLYPHIRGLYVHPFAADDIMLPGALDTMLSYFDRFPHIAAFCSDVALFEEGQKMRVQPLFETKEFHYFSPKAVCHLFAHTDFWIPGPTIFAKKEIFLQYGPFDKKLYSINDWWVNHRIAFFEGVGYIPCAISKQRQHAHSFGRRISKEKVIASWLHLFELLNNDPKLKPLYRTGVFRMFGLRIIYKHLLFRPRYWKYLLPMMRKMVEERLFKNRNQAWLRRVS